MKSQAETPTAVFDVVKQVFSVVFVVAGVAAFYHFSDSPLVYRVIGIVVIVIAALGMMLTTDIGKSVWNFIL